MGVYWRPVYSCRSSFNVGREYAARSVSETDLGAKSVPEIGLSTDDLNPKTFEIEGI